eukprot:jgi/Mesen1/8371/ME000468S07807
MGSDAGAIDTRERLAALRKLMLDFPGGELHAYLVPSEDAHQSEYVAECDLRREFISGFNGSAGLAVVTVREALLWTDGRYFLQASQQLSAPDWRLMRVGEDPPPEKWLSQALPKHARVGVDATCVSVDAARRYEDTLARRGQSLTPVAPNLVDQIWAARPPPPPLPAVVHPLRLAGQSPLEKVRSVRERLASEGARALVVSALDEVAWLLNLRGADVAFNPVVRAYALVTLDDAILFVEPAKVTPEGSALAMAALPIVDSEEPLRGALHDDVQVAAHLQANGVQVKGYDAIFEHAKVLAQQAGPSTSPESLAGSGAATATATATATPGSEGGVVEAPGGSAGGAAGVSTAEANGEEAEASGEGRAAAVWLDPASASFAIYDALKRHLSADSLLLQPSPIALAKALKNDVELAGMKEAHVRDGAAMVAFLAWLDREMQQVLGAPGYFSEEAAPLPLKRKLQEEDGAAMGGKLTEVSVADKLEHLRSQQQSFVGLSFPTISSVGPNAAIIHYRPEAATCAPLRTDLMYLCDSGAQYLDGTTDVTRTMHFGKPAAHEKACYTRVLQGHIKLDTAVFPNGTTGHVLDILARLPLWSDGLDYRHGTGHGVGSYLNVHEEPGYYEDGAFGLRIENVMVVKEATSLPHNFCGKGFLCFEPITWVPLQAKLIDIPSMSPEEIAWVDRYHASCTAKLSPLLTGYELEWLLKATAPLQVL